MRKGFTLAEVLITLGIIGIVAAMTIPTLISKFQEKAKVTALRKAYSILSQAYQLAVIENGTPDMWGASLSNSEAYISILKPFVKIIKVCGTGDNCHPAEKISYRSGTLRSNNIFNPTSEARLGAVLADGMIIGTYAQSEKCDVVYGSDKQLQSICGEYMVDVNGGKSPNKYGDDIFIFDITKYGIIPSGAQIFDIDSTGVSKRSDGATLDTKNYRFDTGCLDETAYGYGCAGWVIENGNMDYLKCTDLSWDGNRKCE